MNGKPSVPETRPALESDICGAIDSCIAHAKLELYRDIGDVAEAAGVNKWVLYKWVQTGKVPAVHIPAFERACGVTHLSKCLAGASGQLVIQAPRPDGYSQLDWAKAQWEVAKAMAEAAAAALDPEKNKDALRAVNLAMDALASVRHQLSVRNDK